ncbi:hypothetical protein TRVL_08624 [Trypanosoma vivax]|nr:hypothetical protein TRVL_08624 [Trypanosoma vivax]
MRRHICPPKKHHNRFSLPHQPNRLRHLQALLRYSAPKIRSVSSVATVAAPHPFPFMCEPPLVPAHLQPRSELADLNSATKSQISTAKAPSLAYGAIACKTTRPAFSHNPAGARGAAFTEPANSFNSASRQAKALPLPRSPSKAFATWPFTR